MAVWGIERFDILSTFFEHGYFALSDQTRSKEVEWVKIFKTEKKIQIQLLRLTEVCGKVLSEKNANKSFKTALLLSNVIDADH